MKQILRGIKLFVAVLRWLVVTVVLNLFVWTIGWWLPRVPPIRQRIEKFENQERQKWRKIESAFDDPALGGVIETFSAEHGMTLEKYYHDGSDWSLLFARKKGGVGKIEVILLDVARKKFKVTCIWWIDHWEDETRQIAHADIAEHLNVDGPAELKKRLEAAVAKISAWGKDDLTEHHRCKGWRKTWKTPEEFERAGRSYQVLDI